MKVTEKQIEEIVQLTQRVEQLEKLKLEMEKNIREKLRIYHAVCEHFSFHNVLVDSDFNDICDNITKEVEDEKRE
jgi:ribosomal protein L9